MTSVAVRHVRLPFWPAAFLAVVGWLIAWFAAAPFAAWFAYDLLGLEPGSHLGDAVAFFVFDVPKVLLLLLGIVTAVTLIRGFFPPEKVRRRPCRPRRVRRDRRGSRLGHRHTVLLVLGGAALHRLR